MSNAVKGRWLTVRVRMSFHVFMSQTLTKDFFSPLPALRDRTDGVAFTTVYRLCAVPLRPNLRTRQPHSSGDATDLAARKVQASSLRSVGRSIVCIGSWSCPSGTAAVDQMHSFFDDVPIT